MVEIEGFIIYFIYQKFGYVDVILLIFNYGWLGFFFEFLFIVKDFNKKIKVFNG